MILTEDQLNIFRKNGFLILNNSNINLELLDNVRKKLSEIKEKCFKQIYNKYRVYDDYSKEANIAGIEDIFSQEIINQDIVSLFEKSNVAEIAKQLLNDDHILLRLDRYHVTSKYSHIGNWHRDGLHNNLESVQLNIYLYDEQGTEIVPDSHIRENNHLENKILSKSVFSNLKNSKPIQCKAGQILAFHPALLHRGKSKDARAHIHFRFLKIKNKKEFEETKRGRNSEHLKNYNMTKNTQKIISECYTIDKEETSYIHEKTFKKNFLRKIKFFFHKILFFLSPQNPIFGKFNCRPCLKMRKIFFLE